MKLYKSYPHLTVLWCALETFLFGGIIYGWSSLVFVLKREGLYMDRCVGHYGNLSERSHWLEVGGDDVTMNGNSTLLPHPVYNHTDASLALSNITSAHAQWHLCPEQDSGLNLWFTIAVAFMYIGLAILGQLTSRLGTQGTRHIFMFGLTGGCLLIAYADKGVEWLLCPGLCLMGLSSMVIFATNIQAANLFPKLQSTIIAILCGLFDSSSVVQQFVKLAYEAGISRRYSYIFLGIFSGLSVTFSSTFLLPKSYINHKKHKKSKSQKQTNNEVLCSSSKEEDVDVIPLVSASQCLCSVTYVSHVTWMSVYVILFVTFISTLNPNLNQFSNGAIQVVDKYTSAFAYTTMGTCAVSLLTGCIYDLQRKFFWYHPSPIQEWRPAVLPMVLSGVLGCLVYGLLLTEKIGAMFAVFVLFTLYRSFLYSIGIAFINDAFPSEHFGLLYGIMTFVNGCCSMLQYPLLYWAEQYKASFQMHTLLLVMGMVAMMHPLQLWKRSSILVNQKGRTLCQPEREALNKEITITYPG